MIPIIDTHQHLWDLSKLHLPWLDGGGKLSTNHVLADYKREAAGLDIAQTVYMEVDVEPAQRVKEAELVFDLCRQKDTILAGAVIGGNPLDDGFAAYIERFSGDKHFKGVRQVLHGGQERGTCLKPGFVRAMRLLGSRKLLFDLCLRPDELEDGVTLARQCPDTRFVLDHCGNPNIHAAPDSPEHLGWKRGIEAMAQQPNVVCKISGIIAQLKPGENAAQVLAPFVQTCVQAFGHDRVMFASDWPVCTLGASLHDWVVALQTIVIHWNEADKRKLFHDNAARVYGL